VAGDAGDQILDLLRFLSRPPDHVVSYRRTIVTWPSSNSNPARIRREAGAGIRQFHDVAGPAFSRPDRPVLAFGVTAGAHRKTGAGAANEGRVARDFGPPFR
jgi:hypothetical protein